MASNPVVNSSAILTSQTLNGGGFSFTSNSFNAAAGANIVYVVGAGVSNVTVSGVTDSSSNTYSSVGSYTDAGVNQFIYVYAFTTIRATVGMTVTVNGTSNSSGPTLQLLIINVTGGGNSFAVGTGTESGSNAQDSITTSIASSLIILGSIAPSATYTSSSATVVATGTGGRYCAIGYMNTTTAGAYTPTFSTGGSASDSLAVAIVPVTLTPTSSASKLTGTVPLAETFTGSATGTFSPFTYAWTFGDGGTSTLQNPSHTYNAVGIYSINLTVTDNNSNTASAATLSISVTAAPSSGGPSLVAYPSNLAPVALPQTQPIIATPPINPNPTGAAGNLQIVSPLIQPAPKLNNRPK
jgi:hypothetical protein